MGKCRKERNVIRKTGKNITRKAASEKGCANGSLYVYSQYSAVFGGNVRESTASAANDLAGNGKTVRAGISQQRNPALSMNEGLVRNAY